MLKKYLFIGCMVPWVLFSQSPQKLFSIALENNPSLAVKALQYEAGLERVKQVQQLPQPELGVGAFLLPVETRLGAQQFRLGIMQMFPWFGTLKARAALQKSKAEVYQLEREWVEMEVFYQLKIAYLSLYETRNAQKILSEDIGLLRAFRSLAESKVSSGKATLADVFRVNLKIQALEQKIQWLGVEEKTFLAQINQVLNRAMDTDILVPDSLTFSKHIFSKNTLLFEISSQHPALQVLELGKESSRLSQELNKKSEGPKWGFGLDYIGINPRTDAFPANNGRDIVQLKASISLPIYRKRFVAKNQEESLRIQSYAHEQEEVLKRFEMQIETALARHEQAQLSFDLYQEQIATIAPTIRILETDYSNQAKGFDDLLQLEGERIDFELQLLHAIVMSHKALAEIERYLPIKKD